MVKEGVELEDETKVLKSNGGLLKNYWRIVFAARNKWINSKTQVCMYIAFKLLPYFPRKEITIAVTELTKLDDKGPDNHEAKKDVGYKEDEEEAVSED